MFRRRRPNRDIPFSFDSFLDVVANVVGIIIRLILVAWVGARACKVVLPPPPPLPVLTEPAALPEPTEPRLDQLAQRRRDLAHQRDEALHRCAEQEQALHDDSSRLQEQIAHVVARQRALTGQQTELTGRARQTTEQARIVAMSLAELHKRSERLLAELDRLRKQPAAGKQLRYHTPVSAIVQTDEVMFECKAGRATLLDTAALLALVRKEMHGKGEQLRDRWELNDVTPPVGAFRLRYVIEREKTALDALTAGRPVGGQYRFLLSAWQAEPVIPARGETAERALASGSDFRKVVDELDPLQTVVTLWVYPDSFPLYRALRDHLHDRGLVVAGRPLPDGVPIASSRHGTASRGQ